MERIPGAQDSIERYATGRRSVERDDRKNKDAAEKLAKGYADHQAKWAGETKEDMEKAEALEAKVEQAEARADRFDLARRCSRLAW